MKKKKIIIPISIAFFFLIILIAFLIIPPPIEGQWVEKGSEKAQWSMAEPSYKIYKFKDGQVQEYLVKQISKPLSSNSYTYEGDEKIIKSYIAAKYYRGDDGIYYLDNIDGRKASIEVGWFSLMVQHSDIGPTYYHRNFKKIEKE